MCQNYKLNQILYRFLHGCDHLLIGGRQLVGLHRSLHWQVICESCVVVWIYVLYNLFSFAEIWSELFDLLAGHYAKWAICSSCRWPSATCYWPVWWWCSPSPTTYRDSGYSATSSATSGWPSTSCVALLPFSICAPSPWIGTLLYITKAWKVNIDDWRNLRDRHLPFGVEHVVAPTSTHVPWHARHAHSATETGVSHREFTPAVTRTSGRGVLCVCC